MCDLVELNTIERHVLKNPIYICVGLQNQNNAQPTYPTLSI
jgi:hypothetical protein